MILANILSEQWLHADNYNFWSSEWGGLVTKALIAVFLVWGLRWVKRRFECHVESPENCHRWGHPVPGTGHRACRGHHPHAQEKGAITAADIHRHHEESGA